MKGYVRISSGWYEIAHCVVSTEDTETRASAVRRAGVGSEVVKYTEWVVKADR